MKLNGQTAIITGAAKGIGRAIATRFAEEGANVVVSDINDHLCQDVAAIIRNRGQIAEPIHCDVLDTAEIANLVDFTTSTFGRVDILVNNAGGAIVAGPMLPLCDTSEDAIIRMLGVNLLGTVWCTRAVLRLMKEQRSGRILNLSSVVGMRGGTPAMYATAKGGVIAFTKSIAVEMAEVGVTVNCISPWAIATREGPARLPTRLPRKGAADDVANLALFLASEEASFITGANHVIDGGWSSGC